MSLSTRFELGTPVPFETLADLYATTSFPDGQTAVVEGADDVLYVWSSFFYETTGTGWLELATTSRAVAWHTGTGAPASTLGNENDYYIDEATDDLYLKSSTPIVVTALLNDEGANGSSVNSISPVADNLYLAAVALEGGTSPTMTALSGCGLTWVLVAEIVLPTLSVSIFRAMESAGLSAGTLTGTATGSPVRSLTQVWQFAGGIVTGGSHGDTAIVQSATASAASDSALEVVLDAFADPVHGIPFGAFAFGNTVADAEPGYTAIQRASSTHALLSEWKLGGDNPSVSRPGASALVGAAVEIAVNPNISWNLIGSVGGSTSPPLFGDGSDSAAVFDGVNAVTGASRVGTTYTLTRDVFYTSATVSSGVTVITAGWRIFVQGTLTNAGTIHNDGGSGNGTTAGAAAPGGFYGGGTAGGAGIASGTTTVAGNNGQSVNATGWHSLGGAGGTGGNSNGGTGAALRTKSPLMGYHEAFAILTGLAIAPSTVDANAANTPTNNSLCGGTGGGGGGRTTGGTAVASGAGGGGAGVVAIAASTIDNSAGVISANGGASGGAIGGGTCVTGGGAGGGGGCLCLVYQTLTAGTETASGGAIVGLGLNGAATATPGSAGRVVKCQV